MRKALSALAGLGLWAVAGVAAAEGEPWAPQSDLFQLNYRLGTVLLLVVAGGIAFGLLATALFRHRRTQLDVAAGVVRRHTAGHMLMHWVNAIGFLLTIFTGAVMLKWINVAMTKPLLYTLHYVGAGAILVGFVATAVNASTRGTTTSRRLIPRGHQVREAFIELLGYAGLVGDRGILGFRSVQWPAAMRSEIEKLVGFQGFARNGKYLAAEEVLSYPFWALVGLAIISTGVLKAARYAYPLPGGVVKWVTIVHDWAAVGAVVMLCVHVAALVLVRTNWPLFASMFTGKVKADYAKEMHGEWFDEVVLQVERPGHAPAGKPAAARKGR